MCMVRIVGRVPSGEKRNEKPDNYRGRQMSTSAPNSIESVHGEKLSQKVIILTRVGWGLVPHHPNGRDKPCRYAELRQKNLTEQSLKCGHIRVLRQPRDIRRTQNRIL